MNDPRPARAVEDAQPLDLGLLAKRTIPDEALRVGWCGGFSGPEWAGPEGLSHQCDRQGHAIEYRDASGVLRGLLVVYGAKADHGQPGQLLVMVDPAHRRCGIATAMLKEATRRGLAINFEAQSYTGAGWATVRKFLNERQTA
jgi:GNAT superfamily N-acetyltransferase